MLNRSWVQGEPRRVFAQWMGTINFDEILERLGLRFVLIAELISKLRDQLLIMKKAHAYL